MVRREGRGMEGYEEGQGGRETLEGSRRRAVDGERDLMATEGGPVAEGDRNALVGALQVGGKGRGQRCE